MKSDSSAAVAMEEIDNIEKLYKYYNTLKDAKENAKDHEDLYKEILAAVKGTSHEKQLAGQFIAKFFKDFPHLADVALDAQFDLCEDEDVAIRKVAIKSLPGFCRADHGLTIKVADVLAQLLQSTDTQELAFVNSAIVELLNIDTKAALKGLLQQIAQDDGDIRDKGIKLLANKIKLVNREMMTTEAEDVLLSESKKLLSELDPEQFLSMIKLLGSTRLGHTPAGQQELVEIIGEEIGLDKEAFSETEPLEELNKVVQCVRLATPYFSTQVNSNGFVSFIANKIFSQWDIFPAVSPVKLDLLKVFAEIVPFCDASLENPDVALQNIHNLLLKYCPLPPPAVVPGTESNGDANEEPKKPVDPKIQFSYVECLLYSLHKLGSKHPTFFKETPSTEGGGDAPASSAADERMEDFRKRLTYLSRRTQGYVVNLRAALAGKKDDELKSGENKLKVVALKTTANITTLIKDLMRKPPIFKNEITLSWCPQTSTTRRMVAGGGRLFGAAGTTGTTSPEAQATAGSKRHARITYDAGAGGDSKGPKQHKEERAMYRPPSGKYSDRVGAKDFDEFPSGGRGGFRGGRGFRGRGRGFRGGRRWY